MSDHPVDDPDWHDWYEDADPEDDCWEDCGLGADGQCSMAGTEWCDWECGRLNCGRFQ